MGFLLPLNSVFCCLLKINVIVVKPNGNIIVSEGTSSLVKDNLNKYFTKPLLSFCLDNQTPLNFSFGDKIYLKIMIFSKFRVKVTIIVFFLKLNYIRLIFKIWL